MNDFLKGLCVGCGLASIVWTLLANREAKAWMNLVERQFTLIDDARRIARKLLCHCDRDDWVVQDLALDHEWLRRGFRYYEDLERPPKRIDCEGDE